MNQKMTNKQKSLLVAGGASAALAYASPVVAQEVTAPSNSGVDFLETEIGKVEGAIVPIMSISISVVVLTGAYMLYKRLIYS